VTSDGRHVVCHMGEAEATRSPRAGIVVIVERVRGLLPHKVPPLALKLCLGGLQVHLPSSQAVRLLLKVGHTATGTLVWRCEPTCLLGLKLTVDVVTHEWRVIVVNVVRVVP
jgi:hypothetical protein